MGLQSAFFASLDSLISKRILITSGPTRAPLDAVRFISNRSTGRFGTLLAEEALRRGFKVTVLHGTGSETPAPRPRLRLIEAMTNRDVERVLRRELTRFRYDAVIHAMAVLDFEPVRARTGKVESRGGNWTIRLKKSSKIINRIKRWSRRSFLVGFKLEVGGSTKELIARGRRLLRESRADLVVANQLGGGSDTRHVGYLIDSSGPLVKKVTGKGGLVREIVRTVREAR